MRITRNTGTWAGFPLPAEKYDKLTYVALSFVFLTRAIPEKKKIAPKTTAKVWIVD